MYIYITNGKNPKGNTHYAKEMTMYVFIRIKEGSSEEAECLTCELLSGDRASEFIENPTKFLKGENNAMLLDHWIVPAVLANATASGDIYEEFEALLALNAITDSPVISDLFATIFESGYQLAKIHKKE